MFKTLQVLWKSVVSPGEKTTLTGQFTDLSLEILYEVCKYLEPKTVLYLSSTSRSYRSSLIRLCFRHLVIDQLNTRSIEFFREYISNERYAKILRYFPRSVQITTDYNETRLRTYKKFIAFLQDCNFGGLQFLSFEKFPFDLLIQLGKALVTWKKSLRHLQIKNLSFHNKFLNGDHFILGLESLKSLEKLEIGICVTDRFERLLYRDHVKKYLPKIAKTFRRFKKLTYLKLNFVTVEYARAIAENLGASELKEIDIAPRGDQTQCEEALAALIPLSGSKSLRHITIRLPRLITISNNILTSTFKIFPSTMSRKHVSKRTLHIESKQSLIVNPNFSALDMIAALRLTKLTFSHKLRFESVEAFEKLCDILRECKELKTLNSLELGNYTDIESFNLLVEMSELTNIDINISLLRHFQLNSLSSLFQRDKTLKRLSLWVYDDTVLKEITRELPEHPALEYVQISRTCRKVACNCDALWPATSNLLVSVADSHSKIREIRVNFAIEGEHATNLSESLTGCGIDFVFRENCLRIIRSGRQDLKVTWTKCSKLKPVKKIQVY
ncbi:hypothetical protein HK098_002735 [Nowakowskiella sp. JEL0407]|nr:hypothetical protein HK098_002735 [Nowakowskiella sp. JEL0407]